MTEEATASTTGPGTGTVVVPETGKVEWCYYCNEKGHQGRQCPEQMKILNKDFLSEEIMKKYDKRVEGTLKVGDSAPDPQIWDLQRNQFNSLLSYKNSSRPLVISFGSSS